MQNLDLLIITVIIIIKRRIRHECKSRTVGGTSCSREREISG
jgi:hypothetical protein